MSNKAKPRCPSCGKALYRTLKPKDKRTTSLYPYCRNESCRIYGDIRIAGYYPGNDKVPSQVVEKRTRPEVPFKAGKKAAKGKLALKKKRRRGGVPASDAKRKVRRVSSPPKPLCEKCGVLLKACKCEPDSITSTRQNISKGISNDQAKSVTALSVAVILQELGDDDIANILIGRYALETYGLRKKKLGE